MLPDQRDGLLFNDHLSVSAGAGQVPESPLPGVLVVLPDNLSGTELQFFSRCHSKTINKFGNGSGMDSMAAWIPNRSPDVL